jgi:serine/threonine-protein kinase HipA
VSTIPYLGEKEAARKFSRTKRFDEFSEDELSHLAARAVLPQRLVLDTARATVALFHKRWRAQKTNLPLASAMVGAIDAHLKTIPIARG